MNKHDGALVIMLQLVCRLNQLTHFFGVIFIFACHVPCDCINLYSRINFKLNRAAALAEWRQLLSA
jgi:hypothetical protein